jgi:hypothetical protein
MTLSNAQPTRSSPWPTRFLWGLKALLALVFLFAALQKFSNQPLMVTHFEEIGLGQGFRYVTAAIEAAGAGLLLWPRAALAGVFLLTGTCAGALAAQLGPLHGDVIHVIVLGSLVLVVGTVEWRSSRRRAGQDRYPRPN